MPNCRPRTYHLNINAPNSDGLKIYQIHIPVDCGNMSLRTDLQCLRTRHADIAMDRAWQHVSSLHWDDSRDISFCENCCPAEAEEYH